MVLSAAEKKYLRKLGHNLDPVVQIGKHGLTDSLIEQTLAQLAAHELIKVKFGQKTPVEVDEGVATLVERTTCELVQQIGRVAMLYRPADEIGDRRIQLPRRPSSITHGGELVDDEVDT